MKRTEPAIGVLIRSHQDRWREWIICSKRSLQTWSINEISSSWNSKAYDMKSTWHCLSAHMLIQLRDQSLYATKILSLFLPTCRKGNVWIALRELIVSYSQIRWSKLKSTWMKTFEHFRQNFVHIKFQVFDHISRMRVRKAAVRRWRARGIGAPLTPVDQLAISFSATLFLSSSAQSCPSKTTPECLIVKRCVYS